MKTEFKQINKAGAYDWVVILEDGTEMLLSEYETHQVNEL